MKRIDQIDQNFAVKEVDANGFCFYNCLEAPFRVYGLLLPDEQYPWFLRMPQPVADAANEGVASLNQHTTGGRVRFVTDSPEIAIKAKMHNVGRMPHFALTGSAGFDVHVQEDGERYYAGTFIPPFEIREGYESTLALTGAKRREITIHFPLYSGVKELFIGVKEGSLLEAHRPYRFEKPVVYYGNSVTQGGCASRPGNSYQNIISRWLDCNHVNLGFSGSGRGEQCVSDYIAGLEMAAFVMDYDHNAPTVEHLLATHERMFLTVRRAQPKLPIIMASRISSRLSAVEIERREIIRATWQHAKDAGDENVWFIDGNQMMVSRVGHDGTVDKYHPTDLGFRAMAEGFGEVLGKILYPDGMSEEV